jgi:hypothetical protein
MGGFLLFGGIEKKMHRYLNAPINAVGGPGEDGDGQYGEDDWADDSQAPAGYGCFAQGGIRCTQGPCGSFSHKENGDRAVDLVWGGMGTTGITAPISGTVLATSTSSGDCSDGTDKGGTIYFKDDNGYLWIFVHAKPTVAPGTKIEVSEDNPNPRIGVVQMNLQSGKCWTGAHAHVMVKDPSGKLVNADTFLNGVGCSFSCPSEDDC